MSEEIADRISDEPSPGSIVAPFEGRYRRQVKSLSVTSDGVNCRVDFGNPPHIPVEALRQLLPACAALAELDTPDRFGAGVEVHVFHATIYDASDGQGNFDDGGCVIGMNSPSSTDPFFESWNGEIDARVADAGQTLADMHGHFYGHGFNTATNWYADDCTHPNSLGHSEVYGMFFELITGQPPG